MYNWLIVFTNPGDDCIFTEQFYNQPDVDEWLRANDEKRAIVVYGRIESLDDHQ